MKTLFFALLLLSACGRAECEFDYSEAFSDAGPVYSICRQADGTYQRKPYSIRRQL